MLIAGFKPIKTSNYVYYTDWADIGFDRKGQLDLKLNSAVFKILRKMRVDNRVDFRQKTSVENAFSGKLRDITKFGGDFLGGTGFATPPRTKNLMCEHHIPNGHEGNASPRSMKVYRKSYDLTIG